MPVVDHFRAQGKVHHIIADRGVEEVFESTKAAVTPVVEKEVRPAAARAGCALTRAAKVRGVQAFA
jgi:hypothetical protein